METNEHNLYHEILPFTHHSYEHIYWVYLSHIIDGVIESDLRSKINEYSLHCILSFLTLPFFLTVSRSWMLQHFHLYFISISAFIMYIHNTHAQLHDLMYKCFKIINSGHFLTICSVVLTCERQFLQKKMLVCTWVVGWCIVFE